MEIETSHREQEWRERIRDVYAAFRRYKLADHIDPDPAFPSMCDDRPLRAEPLHRLPPSAFETYVWKAITTWGTVDDFKHFLPRLLEIMATEPRHFTLSRFTVFGKLAYAGWRQWPAEEREAVERYLEALWLAVLARPLDRYNFAVPDATADYWLRDIADAAADLAPFLRLWEREVNDPDHGLLPAAHLADMAVHVLPDVLNKGKPIWSTAAGAPQAHVLRWLTSAAVYALLESAFFRWADSEHAALLSAGHAWLGWWRGRRAIVDE